MHVLKNPLMFSPPICDKDHIPLHRKLLVIGSDIPSFQGSHGTYAPISGNSACLSQIILHSVMHLRLCEGHFPFPEDPLPLFSLMNF